MKETVDKLDFFKIKISYLQKCQENKMSHKLGGNTCGPHNLEDTTLETLIRK